MCTISWRYHQKDFSVWFNRDEQRERAQALPPVRHEVERGNYLAPIDPVSGGTWVAVHTGGVVLAVLNAYEDEFDESLKKSCRSRGLLVKDLIAQEKGSHFAETLEALLAQASYPPFYLLRLTAAGTRMWYHNGQDELREVELTQSMWTTSSWQSRRVREKRMGFSKKCLENLGENKANALEAFHFWHEAEAPGDSVLMKRSDARTMSIVKMEVREGLVRMKYWPVKDDLRCEAPFLREEERRVLEPSKELS
ncbi:MAG: NRDE family protein [Opitutales bacterium]|nr:NRDE family protein [Opitutales bacterium]